MRALLFAVSFLTRLPLPASVHAVDAGTLRQGPLWFPFVGGLIGAVTAQLALWTGESLSAWVAIFIALAVEARMTGAMHEDALADCCDALGGGWTRERTLEIFKDSRLGTYGVLALVLGVGMRAAASVDLLESLPPGKFVAILTLAGFSGRYLMLIFLKSLPPMESRKSLAGELGAGLGWSSIGLAGAPLLLLIPWVGDQHAGPMGLAVGLMLLLFLGARRVVRRRLGGSTGDVLGCIAFIAQLVVLVALGASF